MPDGDRKWNNLEKMFKQSLFEHFFALERKILLIFNGKCYTI